MDNKYKLYLETPRWAEITEIVKSRAGHQCKICSATENLVTHHTSYQFLYREHLNDYAHLRCLCSECHELVHRHYAKLRAGKPRSSQL